MAILDEGGSFNCLDHRCKNNSSLMLPGFPLQFQKDQFPSEIIGHCVYKNPSGALIKIDRIFLPMRDVPAGQAQRYWQIRVHCLRQRQSRQGQGWRVLGRPRLPGEDDGV